MPVTRSIRIKKQPRPNSTPAKRSARTTLWRRTPAIFGAMICMFAAAMLVGAYQALDGVGVRKEADTVIARSEAATTPTTSPAASAPMNDLADTAAFDAAARRCAQRSARACDHYGLPRALRRGVSIDGHDRHERPRQRGAGSRRS